jgi:hypothetical protein
MLPVNANPEDERCLNPRFPSDLKKRESVMVRWYLVRNLSSNLQIAQDKCNIAHGALEDTADSPMSGDEEPRERS